MNEKNLWRQNELNIKKITDSQNCNNKGDIYRRGIPIGNCEAFGFSEVHSSVQAP